MKLLLLILGLSLMSILITSDVSYSAVYTVTQLTDNSYNDYDPQINDNGFVVWWGCVPDSDYEIFLYDGFSVIQLINDDYNDRYPKINNNGYVVWEGEWPWHDTAHFLYDGRTIRKLPSYAWYYEDDPQINDNGYVVWWGYTNPGDRVGNIFLFDGSSSIRLTDNSSRDSHPQINNNGYVVWRGSVGGSDSEVFLYDGSTTTQLTDNSYDDWEPQINDDGFVVWYGSTNAWYYSDIFLYDGSTTAKLTGHPYGGYDPQINDNGHVVWWGRDDNDFEIFLYDGSTTTRLTDNSWKDTGSKINNNGHVVWTGEVGDGDREVFLYNGSSTIQLTDNSYDDWEPQINDNGYVVWWGFADGNDSEIFLATPYESIQDAIDFSSNGDTVYISKGTYEEDILIEDKDIALIGVSASSTTISGNLVLKNSDSSIGSLAILFREGEKVTYSDKDNTDFEISNNSGITAINSEITVKDCIIMPDPLVFEGDRYGRGIYALNLYEPNDIEVLIENNIILNTDGGIYLFSQTFRDGISGEIKNNTLDLNRHGVVLTMQKGLPEIHHNIITRSQNAIHLSYDSLLTQRLEIITYNCFGAGSVTNTKHVWCRALSAQQSAGEGNIIADPQYADPNFYELEKGDYHLMSQAGRWDPVMKTWLQDNITSPCIDAGDPNTPVSNEPLPNGGRINMGAYGGTLEASKSPEK